jgi:RNA polymerase sigma-70 factor (ECF subfamily)
MAPARPQASRPAGLARLRARRRSERLQREFETLRPLGEAFVLRRFGAQLGRADAEDAVAEVLLRLHRQIEDGRGPANLRAAFFTGVRNASIDLLRARAARPTVELKHAADSAAAGREPLEWAEGREEAARLREALRRLRPNYRRAIMLRYGLGLTVPEIAARLGISLPAAKKLVLRSTRHAKERLLAIEEAEFCPQMQELARRSLFEKEAGGLADEAESEILRAHFEHCGPCRSYLTALHQGLQDLGSAALLGLAAPTELGQGDAIEHTSHLLASLTEAARGSLARLRDLALRLAGSSPHDAAASGALAGAGQKLAALCTAGAATTACLLGGAAGPGINSLTPAEREPRATGPAAVSSAGAASQLARPSVGSPPEPSDLPAGAPRPPRAKRERRTLMQPSVPQAASPPEFGPVGSPAPPAPMAAASDSEASSATAPGASPADEATSGGAGGASTTPSGGGIGFQG